MRRRVKKISKPSSAGPVYATLRLLLFSLGVMTSFGCSLDYTDAILSEELSAEIPDSILFQFTHTAVRDGVPAFRLQAERAEIFEKKKENRLEGVTFIEYGRDGEIITEGWAGRALFLTETENAELSEGISFYSIREDATVTTDYLFWNNENKTLTGSPEEAVVIQKDSGTSLTGTGFEAYINTRSVSFEGPVQGNYVGENDEGVDE